MFQECYDAIIISKQYYAGVRPHILDALFDAETNGSFTPVYTEKLAVCVSGHEQCEVPYQYVINIKF